jgi:hypothetical protein
MRGQAEPEYEGGGWGNSMLDRMSPATRARVMQADAEYERERAVEEREAKQRVDELRAQAFRASVQEALDRGELVDMRQAMRDGGVGRTPREAIEYASAQMDMEDARRAAEVRKAFNEFQGEYYADTSAPTPVELEAGAARADRDRRNEESARSRRVEARRRVKERRAREEETRRMIRADRRLRQMGFRGV